MIEVTLTVIFASKMKRHTGCNDVTTVNDEDDPNLDIACLWCVDIWKIILYKIFVMADYSIWLEKVHIFLQLRTLSKHIESVIFPSVLELITCLSQKILSRISDFSHYPNLTRIVVICGDLSNTQSNSLISLRNLRTLKFQSCPYSPTDNMDIYSKLTQLTSIRTHSQIDIESINNLTNLRSLSLVNPLFECTPIPTGMSKLETLRISFDYDWTPDISLVILKTHFRSLSKLAISANFRTSNIDLISISCCTQLLSLKLFDSGVNCDLVVDNILVSLSNLTDLSLSHIKLGVGDVMNHMICLTRLICCDVINIGSRSIENLTRLTVLKYGHGKPFTELPLSIVYLRLSYIEFYNGIAQLINLKSLRIGYCHVNLRKLDHISKLKSLILIRCRISLPPPSLKFTPLKFKSLERLGLFKCSEFKNDQQISDYGFPKHIAITMRTRGYLKPEKLYHELDAVV